MLESARIEKALARAIDEGSTADLFDQLARSSGLPGPRPNFDLARALGFAIAARKGRADGLLRSLLGSSLEYPIIVGAFTLAARCLAGVDPRHCTISPRIRAVTCATAWSRPCGR
jgi:hypothetical protein